MSENNMSIYRHGIAMTVDHTRNVLSGQLNYGADGLTLADSGKDNLRAHDQETICQDLGELVAARVEGARSIGQPVDYVVIGIHGRLYEEWTEHPRVQQFLTEAAPSSGLTEASYPLDLMAEGSEQLAEYLQNGLLVRFATYREMAGRTADRATPPAISRFGAIHLGDMPVATIMQRDKYGVADEVNVGFDCALQDIPLREETIAALDELQSKARRRDDLTLESEQILANWLLDHLVRFSAYDAQSIVVSGISNQRVRDQIRTTCDSIKGLIITGDDAPLATINFAETTEQPDEHLLYSARDVVLARHIRQLQQDQAAHPRQWYKPSTWSPAKATADKLSDLRRQFAIP